MRRREEFPRATDFSKLLSSASTKQNNASIFTAVLSTIKYSLYSGATGLRLNVSLAWHENDLGHFLTSFNNLSRSIFYGRHFVAMPRIRSNRNMNGEENYVGFCVLALFSLTQSLPFLSTTDLEESKGLESGVCLHNDVIRPAGHNFTSENPCETCICEPPRYRCTVKSCVLRVGCKALHMANECCPQYICDCERNGRTYGNGEKVEEANPCKVCYCTGGEVKCNLVECYSRSDCEPTYVPGRCCPKYDHCPPLEEMRSDAPKMKEPNDVENVSQQTSASDNMATVPTLEIIEIYPTDGNVFQKSEPELKEVSAVGPELEMNITAFISDVTSSSWEYEHANGTEETDDGTETTIGPESWTLASWKETEEPSVEKKWR